MTGQGQFGNTFDDWGNRFVCSNRNHWVHMVLPERYVRRNPYLAVPPPHSDSQAPGGAAKIYPLTQQETTYPEHVGSFTAACSVFVYRGDALPNLRGSIFTCDPTASIVHQEILVPQGSTFVGRPAYPGKEFLASTNPWFRPVFLTSGPDGALYVVDMCRKVVEHPEWMPKEQRGRTDLNDGKHHGRIWRIVPETPTKRTNQKGTFVSANGWSRTQEHADGLVSSSPRTYEPKWREAMGGTNELAAVHSASLLDYFGLLTKDDVLTLLDRSQPPLRAHGVRLAEQFLPKDEEVQKKVIALSKDADARVRFQVALSLGELESDEILTPLAEIARRDIDVRWTRLAVGSSINGRAGKFLMLVLSSRDPAPLTFVRELATQVGSRQNVDEISAVLDMALSSRAPNAGAAAQAVRKGLSDGLQRRGVQFAAFLDRLPLERRGLIAKLDVLSKRSAALAAQPGDSEERLAAVQQLAHDDWKVAGEILTPLVRSEPVEPIRVAAIRALASFNRPDIAALLLESWKDYPPAAKREVLESVLSQPERTIVLLKSLESEMVPVSDLDAARRLQLLNHRRSDVRSRAASLFAKSPAPERKKVIDEFQPALKLAGDPARGKVVFQKATCASCHRLVDVGTMVGPDIRDVRTRSPEALLVDILDPNAAIDANFVNHLVTLKNGRSLTGLIAAETASSVTLQRADRQTDVILRQDIDEIASTRQSLMPEGLEKNLTHAEMADLIAFLRRWPELATSPKQ